MSLDKRDYSIVCQEAERGGCPVTFNEPLRKHTTWRIGGAADLFLEPESVKQAAGILRVAREAGISLVVIGQGSNLLISDGRVMGVVMKVGPRMSKVEVLGTKICAEAGVWVPKLAGKAMKAGLTGLEHIAGIPGTIGGLVVMNGGSNRKNIGNSIRKVRALTLAGSEVEFARKDCGFDYRSSIFHDGRHVITSVELELEDGDPTAIHHEMLKTLRDRRRKFPLKHPNCGSVFLAHRTNSAEVLAPGKLIEEAGIKGYAIGGARVSEKHANFIVNCENARTSEVIELIHYVHDTVLSRTGVSLRCEVKYINEYCCFAPILGAR